MRFPLFVFSLVLLIAGALFGASPALAAGNVTEISASPSHVDVNDNVVITVRGTGPSGAYCEVSIAGVPGYPSGFQFPGYLAKGFSTQPIPFPNPGTYKLTVSGQGDCGGSASTTVTVALASAPSGNITGATISPSPVSLNEPFTISTAGTGHCMIAIDGLPQVVDSTAEITTDTLPASQSFTPLAAGSYDVYVHGVLSPPANAGVGPCTGGAHVNLKVNGTIPTIEKVTYREVDTPRPIPAMIYAGDDLKIDIAGNVDNRASKGAPPLGCNYEIDMLPDTPDEPGRSVGVMVGGTFSEADLGPAPGPGHYHVVVKGTTVQGSPALPCHGEASMAAYFWPRVAYIHGISLDGHGYRVGNSDETNLIVTPNFGGFDAGGSCWYHIAYTVKGNTTQFEERYRDGGVTQPKDWPPAENDNNVKFDITITPSITPLVSHCQIAGPNDTLSKSITFSANPALPGVVVP